MNITVILCTYNRCKSLERALESVCVSRLPDNVLWEVLVVDNNSNDQTRDVVEAFCRRFPQRFKYVFEPQQGKSYALNTGIHRSQGEILAFIDDDVEVDSNWLWNLTAPLYDGDWIGSGGRILPPHSFSPPEWLTFNGPYAMGGVICAHFDLGDVPKQLDRPAYGTNMAFRKSVFEKYGYFRTDIGPRPGEIRNEDTEFGRRLIQGQERLYYVPSAVVYHKIFKSRTDKAFFLKWWFDYGQSQIRENGPRPSIFGIPRQYISIPNNIFRLLPFRALRWLLAFRPQQRFHYKCMVWLTAGQIGELWRKSFAPKIVSDQKHGNKQDLIAK